MSVPSDIESYLTPDEKMVKIGKSRSWEIYITNKRVIFRKGGMFGKEIVEASYRHISSIEHKKKSPWGYIIAGLFCIVFGLILALFYLPRIYTQVYTFFYSYRTLNSINLTLMGLGFLLVIVGIISIVYSLFLTPEFKIHVVGRKPLKISGKGLEDIIKIIRQYREKVEAEITK